MNIFIQTITATDAATRNRSFFEISQRLSAKEILLALRELDTFRKTTSNLYEKVRAILFLYAGYRFFLMEAKETPAVGKISYAGFEDLLARRFEHAIATFLHELDRNGPRPRSAISEAPPFSRCVVAPVIVWIASPTDSAGMLPISCEDSASTMAVCSRLVRIELWIVSRRPVTTMASSSGGTGAA